LLLKEWAASEAVRRLPLSQGWRTRGVEGRVIAYSTFPHVGHTGFFFPARRAEADMTMAWYFLDPTIIYGV